MKKILVTGALGQIGSELTVALRQKYGESNVIATDVRPNNKATLANGPFHIADVCNPGTLAEIVNKEKVDTIFHLAAILSARGEKDPQFCWNINMGGLMNILELARTNGVKEVVTPSSMAVWGPNAPQFNTPQESALKPTTMYGVTKVCGERLCDYYVQKYGLDC